MSLYRKYRPQTFAEVIGQDSVISTLEQAAKQNKLAHAFLFSGSRGTGKTSIARILAKIIMTDKIDNETIEKQIIKGIEEGNIVDLLEIDAASNRGIDDVRELIAKIQFSPVIAKAKVYIIDEAHMLTKESFNALLKTLEEPPNYAYFILATTELNKIPSTIQSRCQCFSFRTIAEEEIIRRLQFIVDQEHIKIDREALRIIARNGQGSMRDAISTLDQMRSLPNITLDEVEQRMGKSGKEHLEPLFEAIDNNDTKTIISIVKKIEETGIALDIFIRMLLTTVRSMLHEAIEKNQDTNYLKYILDTLLQAIRDVRISPLPGLVLESALISLCNIDENIDKKTFEPAKIGKPIKEDKKETKEQSKREKIAKKSEDQIDTKDGIGESAEKMVDTSSYSDSKNNSRIKDAQVEAVELSKEKINELWPNVIEEIKTASVKLSLKDSNLIDVNEKLLTLGFSSSFHKDKIAHPESSRIVEEAMKRILKRSLKIECIIGDGKIEDSKLEPDVDLAEAAKEIF